jgi:hypothetical protein
LRSTNISHSSVICACFLFTFILYYLVCGHCADKNSF